MGTDFFGVQKFLIRLNKIKMLNFPLNQTQKNTKKVRTYFIEMFSTYILNFSSIIQALPYFSIRYE